MPLARLDKRLILDPNFRHVKEILLTWNPIQVPSPKIHPKK